MRLISLAPKFPVKKSFITDHPTNNAMVTGQKDIKLVRVSGGSNMGQAKGKVISKIEIGGGRT